MNVDRSEINFKNLKNAVISGCDEYLKYQAEPNLIVRALSFFNCNVGLNRANKVLLNIQLIPDNHHSDLLCMVIALFKTTSKKLIEIISQKIINGEINVFDHHSLAGIIRFRIFDLSSDIFSSNILNIIKSENELLQSIDFDFNKTDYIKLIFERIYLDQTEKDLVQTYLDYLENHDDLSVLERFNIQNLLSEPM